MIKIQANILTKSRTEVGRRIRDVKEVVRGELTIQPKGFFNSTGNGSVPNTGEVSVD